MISAYATRNKNKVLISKNFYMIYLKTSLSSSKQNSLQPKISSVIMFALVNYEWFFKRRFLATFGLQSLPRSSIQTRLSRLIESNLEL